VQSYPGHSGRYLKKPKPPKLTLGVVYLKMLDLFVTFASTSVSAQLVSLTVRQDPTGLSDPG
jgi:hypothetical protein